MLNGFLLAPKINRTGALKVYLRNHQHVKDKCVPSVYRGLVQAMGGLRTAKEAAGIDLEKQESDYWDSELERFKKYADGMRERRISVTRERALDDGYSGLIKHYGTMEKVRGAAGLDASYTGNGHAKNNGNGQQCIDSRVPRCIVHVPRYRTVKER